MNKLEKEEINLLNKLYLAVINLDPDMASEAAKEASNLDPLKAIEKGLAKGVKEIGDKFSKGECFLPELIMAGEAMKAGLQVLEPRLRRRGEKRKTLGSFLIGTVAGDIHDIGKTVVAAMLSAHGFEVIDLGVDIPAQEFVNKVKELRPDILGLSALMTSTMPAQKEIIDRLKETNLRKKVKVIVGGAAVTEQWAKQIGADAYGADALDVVTKAKQIMSSG